jgi:SPOR domain
MMKKCVAKILIGCFFLLFFNISFAQKIGKIDVIVQDARINTLVENHKAFGEKKGSIKGFRIIIYFDAGNNSSTKALAVQKEFSESFPDVTTYLKFQEPYYKVKVGNYRTRMDAQRFLQKIKEKYPTAYIVKENEIEYPPLNEEN